MTFGTILTGSMTAKIIYCSEIICLIILCFLKTFASGTLRTVLPTKYLVSRLTEYLRQKTAI